MMWNRQHTFDADLTYAIRMVLTGHATPEQAASACDSVCIPTPDGLLLGIKIERQLGDKNAVSSYEMLLRNSFPDSVEVQELRELSGSRL
mgnify:CR=1 FL=1